MTITTKYNIGDEVWVKDRDTQFKGTIDLISLEVGRFDDNQIDIWYHVHSIDGYNCSYQESDLINYKEIK